MLDRVDAGLDRDLSAVEPFGVRRDAVAHPVRLVDDGRDLRARRSARGGSSSSTERAPVVMTLTKSAPRRSCSRTARRTSSTPSASRYMLGEPPAARSGRGDDPPACQQSRAAKRAVPHRLPRLEDEVAVGADVAQRRDAHAQGVAQRRGEEVRAGARPDRLRAGRRRRHVRVDVRMRVDEAGHQGAAAEVDDARAFRGTVAGVADPRDLAVDDQHGRAVAHGGAGAVEQPRVRQP